MQETAFRIRLIATFVLFSVFLFAQDVIYTYDFFELTLHHTAEGNPFRDVHIKGVFSQGDEVHEVTGFYDGDGNYVLRFMPCREGIWSYKTVSHVDALHNHTGRFDCVKNSGSAHGVVRVADTYHFKYDDGTPFYPFGTTCYAWIHQEDEIQYETLKTLKEAPFNKIRMCVFPKWYELNEIEPAIYPYIGRAPDQWDFWRFNPAFFRHLEKQIRRLQDLGIECELILFHPYDGGHWGFDRMTDDQDDFYLRYIIARLSAFRNIWWSVANEYDFLNEKQMEDWDRFFEILEEEDAYGHLRSIHNGLKWYDHSNPLVTHLSIQEDPWEDGGVGEYEQKIDRWKAKFKKPVLMDEMKYEGNIRYSFGDLTAQEMTDRFWYVFTKGAYATHGETYIHPKNVIWWARGGKLYGDSPERIAVLKKIIEHAPGSGFEAFRGMEEDGNSVRVGEEYYLFYFGARQPAERVIFLPEDKKYKLEIIDAWGMSFSRIEGTFSGKNLINLPGKPYTAVRAIRIY